MRPRVLRLITRLNIGGPAIQALNLTHALREDFPTLLAAGKAPEDEGELSDPRVRVHHLPLQRSISPLSDFRAFRAVRGLIARDGPQIIHSHMAKAGAIGRLAASYSSPSPRVVHTFHGHVLDGYFSAPMQKVFVELERKLAKRSDVLIAVSDQVRDSLLQLGIGRESQWRVVPLGFNLDPFLSVTEPRGELRKLLGITSDTALVAAVGRLAPVKDHLLLLESVALLDDVHVVLVGDGEMRQRLELRAAAADLRERVHFVGWRTDIAELLSDVDVVALSSINEGTPVSLIEGLAAARAVVTTDVGGVRAVVDDEETGLVVEERNPDAYARALDRLLNDPVLRRTLGSEGRNRVRVRFAQDRLIAEIRALYEELLG